MDLHQSIAPGIPQSVDDINFAWFNAIFGGKVVRAHTAQVIHGTATKVKVDLEFTETIGGVLARTVWVKTGLEPHSKSIGSEKVYAGETFFYRNFGGAFETRTPECYFADSDDEGNSVIVLDDLGAQGAVFCEPSVAGTPEVIAAGLEYIARYQAASWMRDDLWRYDWLVKGGSFDAADCLAWIYDPAHWEAYSHRPRFALLDPSLRDRDMLLEAHARLRRDWLRRAPWALSHGDAHFGQLYSLPSGEARFLDWQCVQIAHHMQDPANLIVSGLSPADRRHSDRDLLADYVGCLAEFGVENPPSVDEAFDGLRVYAMHQVSWVMCLIEMQPEENCAAITERASAAAMDYGTVGRLLGLQAN